MPEVPGSDGPAPGPLWSGLLDDASPPAEPGRAERFAAVRRHRRGACVGALLVPDRDAAALARTVSDGSAPLAVCLVNTSGAGGLLTIGRRDLVGLEIDSVWSALRDLDDLAGNAARVIAAARQLSDGPGPEPIVRVELPDAPGWERAAEAVEAEGLEAAVRWADGDPDGRRLAARLEVLVELDLGFTVLDERVTTPERLRGLVGLVDALIDGATPEEAADQVRSGQTRSTQDRSGAPEASDGSGRPALDQARQGRIRRRLRGMAVPDLGLLLNGLSGS